MLTTTPNPVSPYAPLQKKAAALAFPLTTLVYLIPIWAYPRLPTQDGPAHLYTVVVLKSLLYAGEDSCYARAFRAEWSLLPNLLGDLFLLAATHVVPPQVAEKMLVSVYIAGFAFGYRYFLKAYRPDCDIIALVCLLFVYNTCLLMGFYNFCLSIALIWIALGWTLRLPPRFHLPHVAILMGVFTVAFLTHLIGFAIAILCSFYLAGVLPDRRTRLPAVMTASLPAAGLALLWRSLQKQVLPTELHWNVSAAIERSLQVDRWLFGPYETSLLPLGTVVAALLTLLFWTSIISTCRAGSRTSRDKGALWILALGFLLLYIFLPDNYGRLGGLLKMRLAIFPVLLVLPTLRLPSWRLPRLGIVSFIFVALAMNWLAIVSYTRSQNADLAAFIAGAAYIDNEAVIMARTPPRDIPDPLEHAAAYYCINSCRIYASHYQARSLNFPLAFHAGSPLSIGGDETNPEVDTVLLWETATLPAQHRRHFYQVRQLGHLRIFRRRSPVANDESHAATRDLTTSATDVAGVLSEGNQNGSDGRAGDRH